MHQSEDSYKQQHHATRDQPRRRETQTDSAGEPFLKILDTRFPGLEDTPAQLIWGTQAPGIRINYNL